MITLVKYRVKKASIQLQIDLTDGISGPRASLVIPLVIVTRPVFEYSIQPSGSTFVSWQFGSFGHQLVYVRGKVVLGLGLHTNVGLLQLFKSIRCPLVKNCVAALCGVLARTVA